MPVLKRGDTWTAYWYSTDGATGKRKQHSKGGYRTKKEAQAKLVEVLPALTAGTWRPDSPMTVEQLLREHYLPARKSEGLRPTTLSQYTNASDAWIIPHIGQMAARQLTANNTRKWQDKIAESGGRDGNPLSPRSVQISVMVLKAATAWAMTNGLLQRDPLSGYKRPRAPKSSRVKEVWTVEQVRQFLASVEDDRLFAAWSLLVTYGPRRGEVCGLRWPAVHLDSGFIDINETRIVVDGHPQASKPKTEAGNRHIPLTAADVAMLKAHRTRQLEERIRVGLGRDDEGFVFTNQLGEPLSPDWLSRRFVELAGLVELEDGSKLPKLSVHGLRHTAASVMRSLGLPPEVIAAVLGHSSTSVLFEVYRHLFPKETAMVGEVMGEALRGGVMTT